MNERENYVYIEKNAIHNVSEKTNHAISIAAHTYSHTHTKHVRNTPIKNRNEKKIEKTFIIKPKNKYKYSKIIKKKYTVLCCIHMS